MSKIDFNAALGGAKAPKQLKMKFPETPANTETADDSKNVAIVPVYSLEVVKPKFNDYFTAVKNLVEKSKNVIIKTADDLTAAVTLGGEAKKNLNLIETKRKEVILEPADFVKSVNGLCKVFTDQLAAVETGLKRKISTYQTNVELERRKAAEKAKQASENLQKEINKEAEAAGVKAPVVPVPVIPEQKTIFRTESGTSSHQAKVWKCYVDKPDDVPREYCEPVGRLLNLAVKQGIREIPGCRIVEENETRFRG